MIITLPLEPQEEARLIAIARAKGLSPEALVREALDKILTDVPALPENPKVAPRPIWDVILDNMKGCSRRGIREAPQRRGQ